MRTPPERGTRERILEVAESSLGANGYQGTRLHQIAARVGIQKASLFHYFHSKEQLYRAVLEEGVGETEHVIADVLAMATGPFEKVRALIDAYVDIVAAHPERTKILLRQSLGDAPAGVLPVDSERLLHAVAGFIEAEQRSGTFAPVDSAGLVLGVVAMVAFFFTSAPVMAPTWLRDPRSPASVERIKRHVEDIVQRCLTGNLPAYPAAALRPQVTARAALGRRA